LSEPWGCRPAGKLNDDSGCPPDAWKEVDALATANDFTNGNNPQRAEDAKGISADSGDAQNNCSSTSGPCYRKWTRREHHSYKAKRVRLSSKQI